jgi:uncharacterized protein YukE
VVLADLVAMDELELGNATGEGLGFALEDFVLSTEGASLNVTGIEDSSGNEIDINWTSLYVGGEVTEQERAAGITNSANVGSYLHPWVIQTVRGSMGLDVNDPSYNETYSRVGNDLALLELATDSYSSNLQNSVTFGRYGYYEATGVGNASENIQTIIQDLNGDIEAIRNRYDGLALFDQLQESIINTYFAPLDQGGIQAQELIVEGDQVDYDNAFAIEQPFYDDMAELYEIFEDTGWEANNNLLGAPRCSLGQVCNDSLLDNDIDNCNAECDIAREAYNEKVEEWEPLAEESYEKLSTLTKSRQELRDRFNATDSGGVTQYSYLERIADRDKFVELCGFGRDFTNCQSGLVNRKAGEKSSIDDIILSLNNGEVRRKGFDVGSTFEFTLNTTDQNGVVTTRDDFLDVKLKGLFIDGTSFRFWSRESDDLANPGAELNGELRLNLFARQISINACGDLCLVDPNVDGVFDPVKIANTTLNLDNFLISLNLGFGEIQPMKFSATSDGNFVFELTPPNPNAVGVDVNDTTAMQNFYDDYYANAPKSFVYVGDVNIGGNSIGSTTIDGFRAQYLRVQSRDL